MNPLLNIISFFAEIICISIWIHALLEWDGRDDNKCNEKECETCPFPCEKHNKHT